MIEAERTTQAVAYLLWKIGGEVSIKKINCLIYLAEMTYLLQYGEFMFSLAQHRSKLFDLLFVDEKFCDEWINYSGNNKISLRSGIRVNTTDLSETFDELSMADMRILNSVLNKSDVEEILSEYGLLNSPNSLREFLLKNGKVEEEVRSILLNINEIEDLHKVIEELV